MSETKRDQVIKEIRIEARVPLVGEELELRNLAAAEAGAELRKMEGLEKARVKIARRAISEKRDTMARLQDDVLQGSTLGMVEGFERWDYDRFEVDTVRRDTGEVTNTRPMSAEERTAYKEPPLSLDLGEPTSPANGEQQKLVLKRGPKPKVAAAKGAH